MSAGTITFYLVVKFVHIAAVVFAFGPTFGYAFFQTVAERTNPRSLPSVVRAMQKVDRFLVTPGMVLILAAGIYLVAKSPAFDLGTLFVSVGMVAILVLFGMQHALFARWERRLIDLAERDIAAAGQGEVALSDDYWAVSKQTAIGGSLAGLIVLVTIFFMAVKP
jgi:uncharacterized membrane protein